MIPTLALHHQQCVKNTNNVIMYHQVGGVQQASRRPLNDAREPTGPSNWTFSPDHTHQGAAVYGWSLKLDARKWPITIFLWRGLLELGISKAVLRFWIRLTQYFGGGCWNKLTLVALETEQDRVEWTWQWGFWFVCCGWSPKGLCLDLPNRLKIFSCQNPWLTLLSVCCGWSSKGLGTRSGWSGGGRHLQQAFVERRSPARNCTNTKTNKNTNKPPATGNQRP